MKVPHRLTLALGLALLSSTSLARSSEAQGRSAAVDQGPLRDNALLLKQNDAEMKRLTGENR